MFLDCSQLIVRAVVVASVVVALNRIQLRLESSGGLELDGGLLLCR